MPRETKGDIFRGRGVEIELPTSQDFLKIRETLTRVGTQPDPNQDRLVQVCHILHKRGRYAIMHYSELLAMDGGAVPVTEHDELVRNAVAWRLDSWGLAVLVDPASVDRRVPDDDLKVVPYRDKEDWVIESRYVVGKKRDY
jgi:hypothetical protein